MYSVDEGEVRRKMFAFPAFQLLHLPNTYAHHVEHGHSMKEQWLCMERLVDMLEERSRRLTMLKPRTWDVRRGVVAQGGLFIFIPAPFRSTRS